MADAILQLDQLTHRFPQGRGVGPIRLELGPGVHGLLGPNGSGKTTLLKTILGFLPPTAGRGRVLGFDIASNVLDVRRHVGYMAENDVFVPGLNAAQTVRLAAELYGMSPARAHEAASEALHAAGLGEEALHSPNRLSTGQRQRMKLAAALVHGPRLLFLDEPTNGLDPKGRRTMLQLIEEVARERGMSVLLSTHILPDVEAVCESALVLRDGHLAAHEKVRGRSLAAATNDGATWHDVEVLGDTDAFRDACKKVKVALRDGRTGLLAQGQATAIIRAAKDAGVVLLKVVPTQKAVEDVLLEHLETAAGGRA